MIELLAGVSLYTLTGGVLAFTQRESINRALESKGLQAYDRLLYTFIVFVWPMIVALELHARLTEKMGI